MILKVDSSGLRGFVWGFCLTVLGLFLLMTFLVNRLLQRMEGASVTHPIPASPTVSPDSSPIPTPTVETAPVPSESPSPAPSLVPQSYQTKFMRLNPEPIRQMPREDGVEVGQIEFNQEITVLEESTDGLWRKVRAGNSEGWVRTDRLQ